MLFGSDMFFNDGQSQNVATPIFVTLFDIVTLVKDAQSRNASPSILITPFGIFTVVNELQL